MLAIEKLKKSRISGVLLLLFIAALYVFQNKAVLPFVEGVVESDLFLADTSELDNKNRESLAALQCNDFVREALDESRSIEFANRDGKAWQLSSGRYLVRSHLTQTDDSGDLVQKNFACNVEFVGGDDTDHRNWSLQGLEIRVL